jgi:small nuclear ribonucleoprotein
MMESSKRPLNVLARNLNNPIQVKLKNNMEYRGKMTECDSYMNLILEEAVEYENNAPMANYGNILIRGNNILYISVTPTQ